MAEEALKIQITLKLSQLQAKILSLTRQSLKDDVTSVTDDFASLFSQLFGDKGQNGYVATLNANSPKESFQFYLKTMQSLKQIIESLPFEENIKNIFLAKVYDHTHPDWLEKIEKNVLVDSDYPLILEEIHSDAIENTVIIKTWGTTNELNNGLKNIIKQQIAGESIGHTATTLRVLADENGQSLIEKYCFNPDGSIKIPFEIKQYGSKSVYEIYWSYWPPGSLSTADEDLERLRKSDEIDVIDTLREMPMELKTQYLIKRYGSASMIPSFLVPSTLKKPSIFTTDIPQTRIKVFPTIAALDIESIEPDLFRRQFLKLKLEEYQLSDEQHALTILIEHYLSKGKLFSPEGKNGEQAIPAKSNFLMLIERFKEQLPNQSMVAQILLKRTLTPTQSRDLLSDINALITIKKDKSKRIVREMTESSQLMHEHTDEFFMLKSQIKELQKNNDVVKYSLKKASSLLTLINRDSDVHLTPNETEMFQYFIDALNTPQANPLIKKIIQQKTLSKSEAQILNPFFLEYISTLSNNLISNKRSLLKTVEKLTNLKEDQNESRLTYVANELQSNTRKLSKQKVGSHAHTVRLKTQNELLALQVRLKINLSTTSDDLIERKMRVGSSNNILLRGFDIEKMLERASALASSDQPFHLGRENCSTTSMKLLHAGAPSEFKNIFEWSQQTDDEERPTNRFLTNPQSLFNAAKLVEQTGLGCPKAQALIRAQQTSKPDKRYIKMLNEIVQTVTQERDVVFPGTFKMGILFFKCIPYLLKLYQDIFQSAITLNKKNHEEKGQTRVVSEIKALTNNQYLMINSPHAALAIHNMLTSLQENKTNIPFFETDTLASVEHYILSIQAKEPDNKTIQDYRRIVIERNDRIEAIRLAVHSRKEVKTALLQRKDPNIKLEWTVDDADKADGLVKIILLTYQKYRLQDPLAFLRSNFAHQLNKRQSPNDQLIKIHEQITHYPNGRTAKAVLSCLEANPWLKDTFNNNANRTFEHDR